MPRRVRLSVAIAPRLTIFAMFALILLTAATATAPVAAAEAIAPCSGHTDDGGTGDGAVPGGPVGGPRMSECGVVLPANAQLPPDGLDAAAWLLADQDSGQILAANAPHVHQPPASVAKVLLAMVALRDLNPDTVITATREDTAQRSTKIGLVADRRYTVRDLTAALIVAPAADAASALARQLGGVGAALNKINLLAASLGARDTNITDPTGLDAPGMSTSAYDTALIFRQAMRDQNFAAASGSPTVSINPEGSSTHKIIRENDNELLSSYNGITGGKAGFTDAAKNIYVGTAQRGGHRIVVALLGASSAFDQASKLMDYGFALTSAHTAPVGDLNNKAGTAHPPGLVSTPVASQHQDSSADQRVGMDRSLFGNVGGFLVAAGGLAMVVMLVLGAKRRVARARRIQANR